MKSPKYIKVRMKFDGPLCQRVFLEASRNLRHNYGVFINTTFDCVYTSADTISATATYYNPGRKLKNALTWYWLRPKKLLRVRVHTDCSVELC